MEPRIIEQHEQNTAITSILKTLKRTPQKLEIAVKGQEQGGSTERVFVAVTSPCYVLTLPKELKFGPVEKGTVFVHRLNKTWIVSHSPSGGRISAGGTRKQAIAMAFTRLNYASA